MAMVDTTTYLFSFYCKKKWFKVVHNALTLQQYAVDQLGMMLTLPSLSFGHLKYIVESVK